MNIVILAGGTGSIALQTGLYKMFESNLDCVDTKVIVNAYDNGLSTGVVRQVMNGMILGPSDVRKNQTTRLSLEQPNSPWLKFLNTRFTVPSAEAQAYCHFCVTVLERELSGTEDAEKFIIMTGPVSDRVREVIAKTRLVREAIDEYFRSSIARKIDYNDFSLANIVYAGLARINGNSLRAAATIMASLMGIKDNVLLNDDTSLFLGAITKSGKRIIDEGDIVSWGNLEDPFVDIFFTDANGQDAMPVLCAEAKKALLEADVIIMSAGTQWSSLIPTYASIGFRETIEACTAKLLLVMNRRPDKDSPGQGASEIINILTDRYFPVGRLHVICDTTADEIMRVIEPEAEARVASVNYFDLAPDAPGESTASKIHDANRLARAVGRTLYRDFMHSDCYVFDYDDTLVGRDNAFPKASAYNVQSLIDLNRTKKVAICTGNSFKAIKLTGGAIDPNTVSSVGGTIAVYADGGVNLYDYCVHPKSPDSDDGNSQKLVRCVNETAVFSSEQAESIIQTLRRHYIPLSKIENRGNAIISIKPIDQEYRPMVLELVKRLVAENDIVVRATGRTTIEIAKKNLSKLEAIHDIKKTMSPREITYVGDEFDGGNDAVVKTVEGVKCLHVKNPVETAFFMLSYMNSLTQE